MTVQFSLGEMLLFKLNYYLVIEIHMTKSEAHCSCKACSYKKETLYPF